MASIKHRSKRDGASYESRFTADALARGYDIFEPKGDYLPFDVQLGTRDGKIYKVQVKGTTGQHERTKLYKVLAAKGNSRKVKITKEDCDVFAVFVAPQKVWYLIPIEKIENVSVWLNPLNEDSQAKYEPWKEAWNVFN